MNVLQFYRTYLPESHGGVEEAIRQICIATGKHGVKHRVLTLARVSAQEVIERPEATVIRAPLQWEPASCSMGSSLFRLYREHAEWADVIQVHYPWPFADLVHILSGVRKPVVVTYHSDIVRQGWLEQLYQPLRKRFFRRVSAVVATSPNYLNSSAFLQRVRGKCTIIPLGLCPESYPVPSAATQRGINERFGSGYFLFVGVLRYYKGLDVLVDAAARNGLSVVIAGKGPEEASLRAQVKQRGVRNVHFAGFVSDHEKAALFQSCRAVVFPSFVRSEAFGVTLLEGLLYGKPLISCDIGTGTTFANLDQQTGIVVPPRDSMALAMAMCLLHENEEQAIQMGKNARERFDRVFSGDNVGNAYFQLYKKALESDLAAL